MLVRNVGSLLECQFAIFRRLILLSQWQIAKLCMKYQGGWQCIGSA